MTADLEREIEGILAKRRMWSRLRAIALILALGLAVALVSLKIAEGFMEKGS